MRDISGDNYEMCYYDYDDYDDKQKSGDAICPEALDSCRDRNS